MRSLTKDWDEHVVEAEDVARQPGFLALRDAIVERADANPDATVLDLGSGTGLLTLALAPQVAQVWALDISPAMVDYLEAKAASAELANVNVAVASAASLPIVDESCDVVVSNYCFHHLSDRDKLRALEECRRVLTPGGQLVFADMMFGMALTRARDREVISAKVKSMLRRGPAGVARLAKNVARFATARWENPARPEWWEEALQTAGFVEISVESLPHEGGIASAIRPQ